MKKARIFIVEDEALVAKDIEIGLEKMNYAVVGKASSGENAVINIAENRPDLVLMDIKLKGRMNGIEAASQIRARFNLPVIYLTANANDEVLQSAKLTGPFGYIIKPFEERELSSAIDIALYKHKMEMKAKWESDVNKALSELYGPLVAPSPSMEEIADVVLNNVKSLTRSAHGYVSTIDPDTGDMLLHVFSEEMQAFFEIGTEEKKVILPCGEDGLYPDLWGHALNERKAFFTNKPEDHPASEGIPDGYLSLHGFLSVPVMLGKNLVGQIALSQKDGDYMADDLEAVVRVAEFYALAIQKFKAGVALQKAHDELETRVSERTAALAAGNADLKREIDTRMQAEGSLRAFLDSIPEAAFLVEISGAVIMANNAFPDSFGIGKKQIIGANLSDLLPREIVEKRRVYVDEVLRTKEPQHYEAENNGKAIHHFIYPVFDSRGEVSRLADLCFDVTLQKQMERQLVQNEKLASIGFLVSGVAHEINNPNNFITFNIPILRDYLNELTPITDKYALDHPDFEPVGMTYSEFREDLFKILENIEHGSTRINRTVSDLRDFSRKKEKTTHVPVDIKDVIEKAVSISRGKIGRMVKTLRVNVPEDMPRVHTDPEIIEHVVINLLINAAQASDKQDSWVSINTGMGGSWEKSFFIEVKDNGSGMDNETRMKIFDPFFTTKPQGEGTGLGLSLCHNLASALGGKVEVESEPGKGSTFRLLLPGNERRAEIRKPPITNQQSKINNQKSTTTNQKSSIQEGEEAGNTPHILIMDDDDDVRMNLREILENEGYRVADAPNGKIGMRLFRENQADLVITDIVMPEKEGLETVKELKDDFPAVKIIVISGGGKLRPEPYLKIAGKLGANKTFLKPFRRGDILKAVKELLDC